MEVAKPEFEAAFKTADSLGMKVYGHVDQNIMFIDSAFDIGLRNYEHILTLVNSVLRLKNDGKDFNSEMQKHYGQGHANGQVERLEMFRFIHDKRPGVIDSLIDKLSKSNTTFSTSIHLMVIISEQLLLSEYGFTISEILQISTINGATALDLDHKYGIIEEGKKADLLIRDKSPFHNYRNFLASKTIIKDGIIFKD